MPLTQIPITSQGIQSRDASIVFLSDPIQIRSSYEWSITFKFLGLDADPTVSILGSNDKVIFSNIASEVSNPDTGDTEPITILLTRAFSNTANGVDGVRQETFPFEWLQVAYSPNGVTSGTVTAILSLMIDE